MNGVGVCVSFILSTSWTLKKKSTVKLDEVLLKMQVQT